MARSTLPARTTTPPLNPRFIRNLRDLGNWVHIDYLYQHFLNAALILLNETVPPASLGGPPPMARFSGDPGNPYAPGRPDNLNQTGGATFGAPHVLTLFAEVTTRALKAAWYQKWYVHRRDRPEEFGGLVHFQKAAEDAGIPRADGPYPCIDPTILDAPVLGLIFQRNGIGSPTGAGTYLLPQALPEGSPMHPSYPAGHATVAGACATILKAFFDENADLTDPASTLPTSPSRLPPAFVADAAGTAPEQVRLQVGGELNKLASNIALGRDGAGVHWRSDSTQGMALGESVVAGLLFEPAITFHELHALSFTTFFTGETVTIGRERPITGDEVFVRITDAAGTILLDERYLTDF
jgi:membrane-associated phospholipid phosphatase